MVRKWNTEKSTTTFYHISTVFVLCYFPRLCQSNGTACWLVFTLLRMGKLLIKDTSNALEVTDNVWKSDCTYTDSQLKNPLRAVETNNVVLGQIKLVTPAPIIRWRLYAEIHSYLLRASTRPRFTCAASLSTSWLARFLFFFFFNAQTSFHCAEG